MSHPDENALAALAEGQVPEAQAAALRAHIEVCDDCRRALALAAGGERQVHSERLRRGESVGRYVILGLLGSGSMGEVYAAFDPELDRKVALKLLRATPRGGGPERLLAEAKAMARLSHPNVVAVHDAGQLEGRVFLAMELVEGQTLAEWLRGQRPVGEIVRVFCALGEGLEAAHRAGVVHRDFKPSNALIGADGRPRVADFGLALTGPATAEVAGTVPFLAPEVLEGQPADAQSDQYSFAAALAHALEGRAVPGWLERAVARGCARAPQDRFPTVRALIAELERDRLRAFRGAAVVGVPFAVLATALGAWTLAESERCRHGEARAAQVWSAGRKAGLPAAFERTGVPFAREAAFGVAQALDRWAAAWAAATDRACRARETVGEAEAARQTLCLEARLGEARELLALLDAPDRELVVHAADAARNLSPAPACLSQRAAEPQVDARALAAGQAQLSQARVWLEAGHQAKALHRAREAVAAARQVSSVSFTAQAQLVLGQALAAQGDDPAARDAFFEAAVAAGAAGDDALAVRAFGRLAVLVAEREPSAKASESWGRLARAAFERSGQEALLAAELEDMLLSVARAEGRTGDVLALAKSCLARRQQALEPEHPLVGRSLFLTAMALHGVGRTAEAPPLLEDARAIAEQAYGSKHPEVARVASGQGLIALRLSKLSEAKFRYEEALAMSEALAPQGAATAGHLDSLGGVETLLGDHAAAREHLGRALELKRALPRAEHPSLAATLQSLAALELATGAADKSLALAREADAMLVPLLGPTHGALLKPLRLIAAACRALGQLDCAAGVLPRIRAVAEAAATSASAAAVAREEGELALARGQGAEALLAFKRALGLRASWEERAGLGRSLLALRRPGEAAVELRAAVDLLEGADEPLARRELCRLLAQTSAPAAPGCAALRP